jgi:outer membrane receptor protein involved in Fe transport
VNFSLAGRYAGKQYVISDQANSSQQLSDYFTLDFTGRWDYSEQLRFKFGVNNLTDKKYSSRAVLASNDKIYYSPAPERNYSFSTTWEF